MGAWYEVQAGGSVHVDNGAADAQHCCGGGRGTILGQQQPAGGVAEAEQQDASGPVNIGSNKGAARAGTGAPLASPWPSQPPIIYLPHASTRPPTQAPTHLTVPSEGAGLIE